MVKREACDDAMMSRISATLKHGKVLERKYLIFFWSCLIFMLTSASIVAIALLVSYLFGSVEEKVSILELTLIAAACFVFVGVACGLLIYLLKRDRKIKREIREWLTDAVKLKAYCEEFGETMFVYPWHNIGCVGDIKVTFRYDGNKMTCKSELNTLGHGTGTVFRKYVNNQIWILYSPEYKQVMLLNEAREQSDKIE